MEVLLLAIITDVTTVIESADNGPRLLSLLSNLRQSDLTLQQFRRALKTYLFG